jgi:hypothetical protein
MNSDIKKKEVVSADALLTNTDWSSLGRPGHCLIPSLTLVTSGPNTPNTGIDLPACPSTKN